MVTLKKPLKGDFEKNIKKITFKKPQNVTFKNLKKVI